MKTTPAGPLPPPPVGARRQPFHARTAPAGAARRTRRYGHDTMVAGSIRCTSVSCGPGTQENRRRSDNLHAGPNSGAAPSRAEHAGSDPHHPESNPIISRTRHRARRPTRSSWSRKRVVGMLPPRAEGKQGRAKASRRCKTAYRRGRTRIQNHARPLQFIPGPPNGYVIISEAKTSLYAGDTEGTRNCAR